jgi:hypothetical protein
MRGKVRELLPVIVMAAAIVGAALWGYSVWRSSHRNDLDAYGAYAIALALLVGSVIAWARRWRTNIRSETGPSTAELEELSDWLAQVVGEEWTREASDRGLLVPDPIPVRWRRPSVAIAGPASTAAGTRWLQPLPGMTRATAERLKEGEIHGLHELYGGLGSGRLVIAGGPGSGKSGAAMLLILAALRHRDQVEKADRPRVPVPVMFTTYGWSPETQPVQDWLAGRLGQVYPRLAGRRGALSAALLLATGKIAVILDGLDEIPEELRPVALQALSQQATFRLVILTRLDEMAAAAKKGGLQGAAAVELQDIDAATAATYLTSVQLDPPPSGWNELTNRLRQDPDAPVAKALSTPLILTLVRDAYREGDSVRELLELRGPVAGTASRDDIIDHLLDRLLAAAYGQSPGRPPSIYDLQTAQHALRCIAAQMNRDGTRDLRWWHIPNWAPFAPRVLTTGLMAGLTSGLLAGCVIGVERGLKPGLVSGVIFGVIFGFGSVADAVVGRIPQRIEIVGLSKMVHPQGLKALPPLHRLELVSAVTIGVGGGVFVAAIVTSAVGLAAGLVTGLITGLMIGFGTVLAASSQSSIVRTSSITPLTAWQSDQQYSRVSGLVNGVTFGLLAGLLSLAEIGPWPGLVNGLTGFALGLLAGIWNSAIWSTSLTFVQLARRWNTPIRIMRLLEDAHHRSVLRTIGPVYQFRHARLQDRLAHQMLAIGPELAGDPHGGPQRVFTENMPINSTEMDR